MMRCNIWCVRFLILQTQKETVFMSNGFRFNPTGQSARILTCAIAAAGLLLGTAIAPVYAKGMETVQAKLTTLPEVPTPITRKTPAKVIVKVEAKEYVGTLADGVQ
jgi:hypothetical protein